MPKHIVRFGFLSALCLWACSGGQTGELFTGEDGKTGQGGSKADHWDAGNQICKTEEPDAGNAKSDGGLIYERFVELKSDVPHERTPDVRDEAIAELTNSNSAFAVELYRHLADRYRDQNLFFSPYAISVGLAMTYAGAENDTKTQMATALHFTLPDSQLHAAFNKISLLNTNNQQFGLVNSIWGQSNTSFSSIFLDVLAQNYDAGLQLVDFIRDPERARQIVNEWTLAQSGNRIDEMLPSNHIDESTRMALVNAAYFYSPWLYAFDTSATKTGDFHTLSDRSVQVPMMLQYLYINYYQGGGYTVFELPCQSQTLSMVIVLPDSEQFEAFESGLDVTVLKQILDALTPANLSISIPKWKSAASSISLRQVLGEMGMTDAFDESQADFSAMDGQKDLYLPDVFHQAFVDVNELGVETVTTSINLDNQSFVGPTVIAVNVDRPFIYFIRNVETNTILFFGRVVDPS
jgi:serpin B